MKKLSLILGSLLLALPMQAVKVGDSLEQVLAEKGPPDHRLEAGANIVLTYKSGSIKLTNHKVVSIKTAAELSAPNLKFTPAPGSAPVTSKPAPVRQAVAPVAAAEEWTTDAPAALARGQAENKKVFLFFTGSDWCGWCKRLDREILTTGEFKDYARGNLVLVKLDFPNKIPQSDALKAQNQQLARKYRVDGYPTVIVLDSAGKKVGELGYQAGGPGPFVDA